MHYEHEDTVASDEQKTHDDSAQNQLTEECQRVKAECEHLRDQLRRVSADFDNFRRRTEKERSAWIESAQKDVLKSMLAIVDDIDRALAQTQRSGLSAQEQSWLTGLTLISQSLYKILDRYGVTVLSEYTQFDPMYHEALAHVPAPNHKSGDIVDVLQKGFLYKGAVLRPAKVTVAQES